MSQTVFSDVLISPSTDAKIQKRKASYKRRNESPKFKDVLRERFYSRMKTSRRVLLDERRRAFSCGMRTILSDILKEEMEILKQGAPDAWDFECEEDDLECSDDDEEQWIMSEYEKLLQEEESALTFDWDQQVICPLCEKSSLLENMSQNVFCPKCNKNFPSGATIQTMRDVLNESIARHNGACDDKCNFALINENADSLYQLCYTCGLFAQVL